MNKLNPLKDFDLSGKVAAITGAGGVLCSCMTENLAALGVKVALLDLHLPSAEKEAEKVKAIGGQALPLHCDVLDKASVQEACDAIIAKFGHVDILINGAGGNKKDATTSPDFRFFDIPAEAMQWVFNLNIIGTVIPCQVFGKHFVERKLGVILNISSMNAFRPLTRVPAYSAAKAGVTNFTQWLAVHMMQEYSPNIRVNALAPGFFLTEQNRFLLTDKETGEPTARGKAIIGHTPQARYGEPQDLIGATIWLVSSAASFVTGITVPIDGGFSSFSGV